MRCDGDTTGFSVEFEISEFVFRGDFQRLSENKCLSTDPPLLTSREMAAGDTTVGSTLTGAFPCLDLSNFFGALDVRIMSIV